MLYDLGDGDEILVCDVCGREMTAAEQKGAVHREEGTVLCAHCHRSYLIHFGPHYTVPKNAVGVYARRKGLLRRLADRLLK